jgi:hypothetical protein
MVESDFRLATHKDLPEKASNPDCQSIGKMILLHFYGTFTENLLP